MDVGGWLRNLGLEQYEAVFRENEINERVLPSLTAEDLKELGVAALGHRRTFERSSRLRLNLPATTPLGQAESPPNHPPIPGCA